MAGDGGREKTQRYSMIFSKNCQEMHQIERAFSRVSAGVANVLLANFPINPRKMEKWAGSSRRKTVSTSANREGSQAFSDLFGDGAAPPSIGLQLAQRSKRARRFQKRDPMASRLRIVRFRPCGKATSSRGLLVDW